MAEPVVDIPDRSVFKASEVCELAQIPPYVLKSWEKEFPGLGAVAKPGGPRVYRRSDVEQVLEIKRLLFAEGLTLAGARRKLEGEPRNEEPPAAELVLPDEIRARVARVKRGLRSLLDSLSEPPVVAEPQPHQAEDAKGRASAAEREADGLLPLVDDADGPSSAASAASETSVVPAPPEASALRARARSRRSGKAPSGDASSGVE